MMRGGSMINVGDFEILVRNISSLKETSIDSNEVGSERYMTLSEVRVVNFDSVKREYIHELGLSVEPKSNDALYISTDGRLVFIEFKNGFIDREKQFAIRKKIYDSVLIFSDIVGLGISIMRKEVDYVLVINEDRNSGIVEETGNIVQPSTSYDDIAKYTSRQAKEKYIPFGIRIFKNYCFREVDVFSKSDFERYVSEVLERNRNALQMN